MANILIAGGSGLIGQRLSQRLLQEGHAVAWLSRRPHPSPRNYVWDYRREILDPQAVEFADYLIHLAGHNLSEGRWTAQRKKEILDSRVQSTLFLGRRWKESGRPLKGYLAASAVGFYGGVTTQKVFTEEDPPGTDFLAEVCRAWETAIGQLADLPTRVVVLRTGVALSPAGGMLPKVLLPTRLGLATAFGTGRQVLPWIHLDDLCGIYLQALQNPGMRGIYNAVAPQPVCGGEFMEILSRHLRRPFWLPNVPAFLLRAALGEMSVLLLEGSRISSARIEQSGFSFRFPDLPSALRDLIPAGGRT